MYFNNFVQSLHCCVLQRLSSLSVTVIIISVIVANITFGGTNFYICVATLEICCAAVHHGSWFTLQKHGKNLLS